MKMKYYLERAEKNTLDESLLPKEERRLVDVVMEFIDASDLDGLSEKQIELFDEILFITEADDGSDIVDLTEQKKKMVVRAGKKVRKLECPEGMKAVKGKCVRMAAAEKTVRKKAAKVAARKRKGKTAAAARKRARSLAKR